MSSLPDATNLLYLVSLNCPVFFLSAGLLLFLLLPRPQKLTFTLTPVCWTVTLSLKVSCSLLLHVSSHLNSSCGIKNVADGTLVFSQNVRRELKPFLHFLLCGLNCLTTTLRLPVKPRFVIGLSSLISSAVCVWHSKHDTAQK